MLGCGLDRQLQPSQPRRGLTEHHANSSRSLQSRPAVRMPDRRVRNLRQRDHRHPRRPRPFVCGRDPSARPDVPARHSQRAVVGDLRSPLGASPAVRLTPRPPSAAPPVAPTPPAADRSTRPMRLRRPGALRLTRRQSGPWHRVWFPESDHENSDLERQRHSRASGAAAGMGRARPPRRRLPAGNQGVVRSDPDGALRDGRLLVLLARRRRATRASPCTSARRSSPERPRFSHPAFDYENRIVMVRLPAVTVVSVYVPNGGKDYPAKLRFLAALEEFAADVAQRAAADRDLRRPQHRADRHGRAPEGAQAGRHRPAAGGARSARAHHRPRRPRRHRPRARAGRRPDVHVVGAVAEHAPAQHRLAPRLRAGQPRALPARPRAAPCSARSAPATTRRWWRSSSSRGSGSARVRVQGPPTLKVGRCECRRVPSRRTSSGPGSRTYPDIFLLTPVY